VRASTARRSSRAQNTPPPKRTWVNAEEGEVHKLVFEYVAAVERQQFLTFDRFVKLEALYDPNAPNLPGGLAITGGDPTSRVIENVIASNVDTVAAAIAATDVRPRYMTDDGDWTSQRTATQLEWYSEGLGTLLDVNPKCRIAFKESAKKGTGVIKVYANEFDEPKVEHVRIDDIIVDEAECRSGGTPRQMHQRMTGVDREELKARFPEFEHKIDIAQRGWSRFWAGYRPIDDGALVAIESWKLPIGRKGRKGYRPGRHTITIDGCDLLDEPWDKPFFPFACMVWSERTAGWYGISLSERIAGLQRALNHFNWQIETSVDRFAVPTTWVGMADAQIAVQTINRLGTIGVYRGQKPETVTPQAVSGEVYNLRREYKSSAYQESGVSEMAARSMKPAGVESAVAMRELRDQSTQRFSMQEKAYERLVLDVHWLLLDVCKDLGDEAPVIARKAKFGARRIKWADVDMTDVRVQIQAASTLGRTPAGRYQTALEWAQAGVISTDEWRRLTKHPDLDRVLSLYTQGMESIERDIEAIEDGYAVSPEPYGNLMLMSRMGRMAYLRDRDLGAPEEILEGLRQYVVQAIHMDNLRRRPPANENTGEPMPGGEPMPPGDLVAGGQPTAALAPEAMNLMAG
jgi:hypothetical protein